MNPLQLIVTICAYILAVVFSLLLGMAARRFSADTFRLPAALHGILLFLYATFAVVFSGFSWTGYFLLAALCSGLSLSVWALRNKDLPWAFKAYFGAYLLSLLVFLWSPSLLFYSISGNLDKYRPEQQFHLEGNTFLVEQQSMLNHDTLATRYKVIRKYGIYNKTLVRNLDFGERVTTVSLDSMHADTIVLSTTLRSGQIKKTGFRPGIKKNTITRKVGTQTR